MKNRAVFFDRDGVINYRLVKEYVKHRNEFHFIPDIYNIFKWVKESGRLAIVVTNQQGLSKGLMTEEDFHDITAKMQAEINEKTGWQFDDVFFCRSKADENSYRRKPNPGMIFEAQEKWDIDLSSSWMIGDRRSDTDAGKNAGVRTILLGLHHKNENILSADYIVKGLDDALDIIKSKD